ncbi:DegT/DnrJ/EryC1/StrS family aminotransferase [Cellulomonas dongxiuzhuiae]|uniref:DegT/DnrJ/EryC1/StrS family aminotransferase n=1 Tax=Cellulomonas dongxiuzhuiae TaxID=2819979 RepID=A0ABX8GGK1_9CELL|nr:DegT/DnrJ/EryC1/StrS family aminotransferase [Cellulomonas dongxiuzhuiae]MBO3086694.1 DegT/DnrJ/EryC1/StrS family aminotransferase [Cellulomonas dongxiuzhuiae]MBO3093953.1 DegT/DnrJ/EryC1/StrS family aminotransferase [Cellulomonas dongxiuzhuiae]QWC15033.1 DegT/DnrJ/EryC1/StrS family aminotransferase [Cellulomonas dongxiuzhuiae]
MTASQPEVRYSLSQSTWDDAEHAALQRVIASGQFTMSAETAEYERVFADFLGTPYCVAVNSGSTANLLMTAALRYRRSDALAPGDEVIVPAVSWPTTYYPLSQYGLRLKFVDIDAETLNYDLDALEAAITDRTRLVMVVNLLGNANDFDRIRALCEPRGIDIVEDNCESLGATFGDRQCGTHGLMGTFSSFFSHHISTMEGGVICTADEELYHILLSLRAHGWTRNLPKFNQVTGEKSDDPFEESFKFVLPGYSVRPLEMSAAVGIEQIAKLPGFVADRRRNAARYLEILSRYPQLMTQREIGEASWFGFSMVVRPGASFGRSDLVRAFQAAGIECRPIVAGNFAKNPVMRWLDHEVHGTLRNADLIDTNGLFIGNREGDLDAELDLLASVLDEVVGA